MSTATDDELLSGLTDEERAALAEPDTEDQAATQGELEDKAKAEAAAAGATEEKGNGNQDNQKPAGDDAGAAAAAGDGAAAAAGAGQSQPAGTAADEPGQPASPAQQQAPILVSQAPADAEAKLADIATQKATLRKQHDEGDITTDELLGKMDALNKQERDIEFDLREAKLAEKLEMQRQKNQWDADCASFLDTHKATYGGDANKEAFDQLNQTIMAFAKVPMYQKLSGPEMLQTAHKAVMALRGTPVAEPKADARAPQQKIPKAALPPDIGGLPAATANDPAEGKWASLDKLQTTNPGAYEEALAKLSEADREAYLSA